MKSLSAYLVCASVILSTFVSCSTTKVLSVDERRLQKNKITVVNDNKFPTSSLNPYLKQQAKGWSPFMCVYNWEDGKNKGWDKFVHKLGTKPVVFDSLLIASSNANLKDHLENLGYYNSTVENQVVEKRKKIVTVKYFVTLGKRYPIHDISYDLSADEEFNQEFREDICNSSISVGSYLSEDKLEKESSRAAIAMRNKGYYDFNKNYFFFEADTISYTDSARLRILVKNHTRNENEDVQHEFKKYSIGKISVTYPENLRIREKVIRDLNSLHSGDEYSDISVHNLYSRYNAIQLFNSVNVELNPRDSALVDCDIRLQKGKLNGFKVGLEASINSSGLFGISPELSYYNKNIFHGGEWLDVSFKSNHQMKFRDNSVRSDEFAVAASLTFPRFLPFSTKLIKGVNIPRTQVKCSFNYQNRPEYKRNQFSASFGYTGNLNKTNYFMYKLYPLSLNMIHMPFISEEFRKSLEDDPFMKSAYEPHFDFGLNGSFYYGSTNTANTTKNYWYMTCQGDLSGNLLSLFNKYMPVNEDGSRTIGGMPYSQYVRCELTFGSTLFWGSEKNIQSFAFRILAGAGYAYGNSTALPFEKHFYVGGANSMRGWAARTLGPGSQSQNTTWKIPNQTGDMKLEANIEYRIRVVWKLEGALFVDAGNVWNLGADADEEAKFSFSKLPETIALSWGPGVRVNLGFLLLRVDLGMRLHDPAVKTGSKWVDPSTWFSQNNYAVHFGVGYPF